MKEIFSTLDKKLICKEYPDNLNWGELGVYNSFILVKEGKIDPEKSDEVWLNENQDEALHNYVSTGGGLLALHCALANYPEKKFYRKMIKGSFSSHPTEHPKIKIEILDENHPVTSGVNPFSVVDEQYFVEVDRKNTDLLLKGSSVEHGESPTGWSHGYDEGKVCCLTPGHNSEVLENPMMVKLIRNAIRWLSN